jgi:hypothetical protein
MEVTTFGTASGDPQDSSVAQQIAEQLLRGEKLPDTEVFMRLGLEELMVGGNAPANLAAFRLLTPHLDPKYALAWSNALGDYGYYSVHRI